MTLPFCKDCNRPFYLFVRFAAQPVELLEQFLLLLGQIRGDGHDCFDEMVAASVSPQVGDALPLQPEGPSRLGSPRYLKLLRARQRRHLHRSPQGRLQECDGNAAVDVIPVSFKYLMIFNLEEDVQIAARTAVFASFPFTPQTETGPCLHPGRYLELNGLFHCDLSSSGTFRAGGRDHASLPPALGTGRTDAEEAAGLRHLTPPLAEAADLRGGPRGATRSPAG